MEFINLRRLKDHMRTGPLPSADVAKYVALQAALGAVVFVPSTAYLVSGWEYVVFPSLAVVGVFYCYRCNGGAAGVRFAERYLAIGWVVGWRVAFVAFAMFVIGFFIAGFITPEALLSTSQWPVAARAVSLTLIACVYWRMGVHICDVSEIDRTRHQS